MDIRALSSSLTERLHRGARRGVWRNRDRLHLQVREVDEDDRAAFAVRARRRLEAMPGVHWARYNGYLARVVVEADPARVAPEAIVRALAGLEEELCASASFAQPSLAYPGDAEPERRTWIEVAADGVSLAMSAALRLSSREQTPHDIDFAAMTATLDGIPRIRSSMEASVSRRAADLTIELLKASAQVAVRSEMGPLSSLFQHALAMRESYGRRLVWAEREPELCSRPDDHPPEHRGPTERPAPLRSGPVERYEQAAIPASLATFGAGLFFTRDVQNSAPPLFAGLPRAARRGRAAFGAHLSWMLSRRGILILDADALCRLDRIDTVVLPQHLVEVDEPGARRIIRRARALGLPARVLGNGGAPDVSWLREDERLAYKKKQCKPLRRIQRTGSGVLLIAGAPCDAFRAADVTLALASDPPPWGAHLVARHGVEDALLLLDALIQARRVAEQSVGIAVAEAATGAVISFAGLERQTTRRVMTLANASAITAIANGVRLANALHVPAPAPPSDETPYHAMSPSAVLDALGSGYEGLSPRDAGARQTAPPEPPSSVARFGRALLEELSSPITPILGAGAGLSAAVGSVVDAGLIVSVLAINGLAGALQRSSARRAIDALATSEERAVRVVRDGRLTEITSHELVRGDVVDLRAGEIAPADCRLIEAVGLEVDESSLTGESLPVEKRIRRVETDIVAERASMIYAGTSVASGRARGAVVALGPDTEMGRAHASTERRVGAIGVEARLEELALVTGPVAGASALGLMGAGLLQDRPFAEVITSAVSLGAAAIPEGLPILSTLAQLASAKRLTKRGALVRNPRCLEALGRVDVLCADKTGTLTEGRIRLAVISDGERVAAPDAAGARLRGVLAAGLRASPTREGSARMAHPTDEALVRGAEELGVEASNGFGEYRRGSELPFGPGRGFHASIGWQDGACLLSVKGAPEVVLPRCTRSREGKLRKRDVALLLKRARRIARDGHRVLAVAERTVRGGRDTEARAPSEGDVSELRFLGFLGLADPVRASAQAALRDLGDAGVRVIMVTGDHPSTAGAIAHELGLPNEEILTGGEMAALEDDELGDRLERCSVFARVTPAQKVRLVRVLSARGKTVAMTGDGANDAAAIALADVGIAVGAHSTAAARSVADLVVTDGRIETIVDAILEGRAMWASVRDAVSILVGGNFGEIGFTLVPGLITGQAPLNARQLLLVNLVTDTLPALAIAVAPPRREDAEQLLREGPEASLGRRLDQDLVTRAAVTGGAAASAYVLSRLTLGGARKAGTVGLVTLTGAQLGQTLVAGGRDLGVLAASAGSIAALLAVVETPGLSHFFGCRPLGPIALAQAIGASAVATGVAWAIPRWLEARRARAEGPRWERVRAMIRPLFAPAELDEAPPDEPLVEGPLDGLVAAA